MTTNYTPEVQKRLESLARNINVFDGTAITIALHELQRRGERIAELEEDAAAAETYDKRISELTDQILRRELKEDWNRLWGPHLEDLGAVVDRMQQRIAAIEAQLKLADAWLEAELTPMVDVERSHKAISGAMRAYQEARRGNK